MTKTQAFGALLDMVERKVAIYEGVTDPKQRAALKEQIKVLTWAASYVPISPELRKRQRALEGRFPL